MQHTSDASPARLALENGSVFYGRNFGSRVSLTGEVVFNTAMCGYQEAITDPSYTGQILVMTAPQMGNYGVGAEDIESGSPSVAGFVVRELSRIRSNYRSNDSLSSWLDASGVPGIEGIDTRALVRILRTLGAQRGIISTDAALTDQDLVRMARESPSMTGRNLAGEVSPASCGDWCEGLGTWALEQLRPAGAPRFKVVALDCGAKHNIYRNLVDRGCEIVVMPHDATPAQITAQGPDGLFISNGPGDPAVVDATIRTLRELISKDASEVIPTFGICLGHQLLALAMGAKTWKLKFGHRGANQPVRNLLTGRVEITSQNHGFCVDEASLVMAGGEATHIHLNDGTVAGFRHTQKPIFSVQYHPEASPGPHDSAYLFDCFVAMMESRKPLSTQEIASIQSRRAGA
ncbi:MAG: glutamine-hydrolyzing carbamoyl-phosphate synthase small subunit, partial [Phycisphaerae bacterium]|nr:glutamine-hydrolyzing carbamoyl-phosphate synthase small subunit [Phycisphaerae bacterium]